MKFFFRFILTLLAFLSSGILFSQASDYGVPLLWLKGNDIQGVSSQLNAYPKMHTKSEGSARKFSGGNHIFVVYRSGNEEPIMSILGKESGVFVGSQSVFKGKKISTEGYSQQYGELVDVKVSAIENGELWVHSTTETEVYEIMVFDKYLSRLKINEIRTYLAIKYGLDLSNTDQYVYGEENIWEKSEDYDHAIFGIGYLDTYNLLQKQSVHSKDGDLKVSYATRRSNKVKRGDYVLFGNNDKPFSFNTDDYNNKQWLCRSNMDEVYIDLYVPQEKMSSVELDRFLVELHFQGKKQSYAGVVEKEHIVFRNVRLTKGDYILKLKGEKTALNFDYKLSCDTTNIIFSSDYEGQFNLQVTDDKGAQVINTNSFEKRFELDNNSSAYFDVRVASARGDISRRIYTLSKALADKELKETYTLNDTGQLLIQASTLNVSEDVERKWMKDGEVIAQGNYVQINKPGRYSLVSTMGDCSVNQSFAVFGSNDFQQWTVYPNPGKESEPVSISFDLEKDQDIKVDVYHVDGKKVRSLFYEDVHADTYEIGFLSKGQYIIVAYIDALPQIKKIVIK